MSPCAARRPICCRRPDDGYLRRNPDDLPDNNFTGYDFWLAKMNSFTLRGEDARNESVVLARVRRAEMVKAFITSIEYRQRFAP